MRDRLIEILHRIYSTDFKGDYESGINDIAACKCGYIEGVFAVEAAESAIRTQKKKIIKTFMEKATPEEIKEVLGSDEEVEDE